MRKMKHKSTGSEITVVEHIITTNFWEYYVTDDKFSDDIIRCVVMGYCTEMGDVSLKEIKPYIKARSKNLSELVPASGYEWVE